MRIWSLHPKYLDKKGLVAVWRETLLAKSVLEGLTKGYKNHPQLLRFKTAKIPLDAINQYLSEIYKEAVFRNYKFNREKINWDFKDCKLSVTSGQIQFESEHLLNKLMTRDLNKYNELSGVKLFVPHQLFDVVEGEIEFWEKLSDKMMWNRK